MTELEPAVALTIDQLARAAGTTVRNVRAYQDRGILPPPLRRGRSGIYAETHLARLRLIQALLARGYSIGNIGELIAAWETGRDLEQVLGLEAAVASPFATEQPGAIDAAELASAFGADAPALAAAVALGIVEPAGGTRFRVPSPRTLEAGIELYRAGVPVAQILDLLRAVRRDTEKIAERLVAVVVERLFGGRASKRLPRADDLAPLADAVWRLRPLADKVVGAELARALEGAVRSQLGERIDHVIDHVMKAKRKPRAQRRR